MNGDTKRRNRLIIEVIIAIIVVVLAALYFGPFVTAIVAILMILGISWDFTHPNSRRLSDD